MHSLFRLYQHAENSYFLSLPKSMLLQAEQAFKKYALFSKVTISNASKERFKIGLYGSQATALLATASSEDEPIFVTNNGCVIKHTNEGDYTLCRLPCKLPRYEIIACVDVMKVLWLKICKYFVPITTQAWELLDIQSGIPMVYPETIDQILPHHANLPILEGVSFNKGCYLGQEIIARMQYKGKIKKHTYRFSIEDKDYLPKVGEPVIEGKSGETRGIVMRHSTSNQFAHELLIVLEDAYANAQDLLLGDAQGPKLNYLELPYAW